jgi:hypothetical protein
MICHDTKNMSRKKFATQVDTDILTAVRAIAQEEGRQIQTLVDEALSDLIEKRRKARPRPHVMAAYQASHAQAGSRPAKFSFSGVITRWR